MKLSKQTIIKGLFLITILFLVLLIYFWRQKQLLTPTSPILDQKQAQVIAEKHCIKSGENLSFESYNPNSKTWWFTATLNSTPDGCLPACVVNEQTGLAEINWRCTGATPLVKGNPEVCGIENCHGTDIICGSKPAEICTEIYQLGDRCRQFAQCAIVNGSCQQINNPKFNTCKDCVQKCETDFPTTHDEAFACENKCLE